MSSMVFEAVGRTLVLVHNKDYPTDAEWDAYLHALARSSVMGTSGAASS